MSAPALNVAPERSVSAARDVAATAPARCRCYGAFSELLASPHDVDVRASLPAAIGAADALPYTLALDALLHEHARSDLEALKAEYSGLFEVGSQGPPAPIREDLLMGQKGGRREDIVRFYEFFGYRLAERFAWAPDHLSVELEFMHFLVWHEANAAEDTLSWQLGQVDFAERHLQNWVPKLAGLVAQVAPEAFYGRVLLALRDFLAHDLQWQASTIIVAGAPTPPAS